jgi:micrococcal nuclease
MYEYQAKIISVVDGDTVDVEIDLGFKINIHQRIRLAGINTPERGEHGFLEAKQCLTDEILNKIVKLQTTKISKWGYYLGDIYSEDKHINQFMIDQGFAKPYFGGTK